MPDAIFFDLDGTLVDSNDFHVLAFAEAFHAEGHDLRLATIHAEVGKGADLLVRALLPEADDDTVERIMKAHGRIFRRAYLPRVKPFDGAAALLRRCHEAGAKVILASSASKKEVAHYVDLLGVEGVLDAALSADDVAEAKPRPDIFEAALARAGVSPDAALAVGDTPYDIEAARRAGVAAVAVRSGLFGDSALAGATAIYDNVAAILADFEDSPLSRA